MSNFLSCTPIRLINFRVPMTLVMSSISIIHEEQMQRAFMIMGLYVSNTMFHLFLENEIAYTTGNVKDDNGRNEFISFFDISFRCRMVFYSKSEVKLLHKWLDDFTYNYKEIVLNGEETEMTLQSSLKNKKPTHVLKNVQSGILMVNPKNLSKPTFDLFNRMQQSTDIPYHMCKTLEYNVTWNRSETKWEWQCEHKYWYYIVRYGQNRTTGPEDILTYTCFTVSCLSLFVSFPLHRCSQMSKTVPGKNMENLMVTLFLAQVTFMFGIGQEERTFCLVSSIMIHYFYLCSFCWMNLCMVHIMFVLSRMKKYPNQSLNSGATCRRFTPLVTTGYILPACIVIPCVLLDFVLESDFRVGYIEHGICFPTHYPENLYVFVIPICVSLFINILCLVRVIFIINTAVPDGFDKTKFRRYVPVYLKLTIVSGLSWVFGIISESTGNVFLRYCFILFTGLQGLMLCVSFVFSGNVWTDVKSRVLCCSEQDTTSTILELSTAPSKTD